MIRSRLFAATWLACFVCKALAADPGEAWFTETAGSGTPPEQVQWLPLERLCKVLPKELSPSVRLLASKPSVALNAKTLVRYAGKGCRGKYGQRPYLVRAVSAAGEGRLDAGWLDGAVWMRFAGLGGQHPFEKTPVVVWLELPPQSVHISVSFIE